MSALRLINETTVTNSSSVTITNMFNEDFDIYKVEVVGLHQNDGTQNACTMRLVNSSGSVVTASEYDKAQLNIDAYASYYDDRSTNQDKLYRFLGNLDNEPSSASTTMYVFNPYSSSSYTFMLKQGASLWGTADFSNFKAIAVLTQLSSITGINFFPDGTSGKTLSGVVRTYGLRVDS
jgi:hypothetical protein